MAPVARRPSEIGAAPPTLPEHWVGGCAQAEEEDEADEADEEDEADEDAAEPMGASTSPELKLNQSRLVGAALLRWAMHRPRGHRSLRDTTPVRVHRRHARVLLLCGCADAVVDSDEIVE